MNRLGEAYRSGGDLVLSGAGDLAGEPVRALPAVEPRGLTWLRYDVVSTKRERPGPLPHCSSIMLLPPRAYTSPCGLVVGARGPLGAPGLPGPCGVNRLAPCCWSRA